MEKTLKILICSLLVSIIISFRLSAHNDPAVLPLEQFVAQLKQQNINTLDIAQAVKMKTFEFRISNPQVAIEYLNWSREVFLKNGITGEVAVCYSLLGQVYVEQEMYYIALSCYKKSYELSELLKNKQTLGYMSIEIGNMFYAQKIYDEALRYYRVSVKNFEQIPREFGITVALNNIGMVYQKLNKLDSALLHFHRAYQIRDSLNNAGKSDIIVVIHSLNYEAECYNMQKQYQKAIDLSRSNLSRYNKKDVGHNQSNQQIITSVHLTIAQSYFDINKPDSALYYANMANEMATKMNDFGLLNKLNMMTGNYYQRKGEYGLAIQNFEAVLKLALAKNLWKEGQNALKSLANCYFQIGKADKASAMLDKFYYITDSISNSRILYNIKEVQQLVNNVERERQTQLLKQKIKNQQIVYVLVSIILLVFSTLAIFLYLTSKKARKRFEQLSNATSEGIIVHDGLRILDVNSNFEMMAGMSTDEIKSNPLSFFFEQIPQYQELKKLANAQEKYLTNLRGAEYKWLKVEVLNRPFAYYRQFANVMAVRDITPLFDANQKLTESEKNLQKLNASKNMFFSIIAHDLRGPLGSMLGVIDYLIEKKGFRDEDAVYMKNIRDTSKHINSLLNNLLDWARSQSNKIVVAPINYSVDSLLLSVIALYKPVCESKKISLLFEPGENPPVLAFFDLDMVQAIVRNLLSNAIKYTQSGGCVKVSTSETENEIKVVIADNGIGMSDDLAAKLFKIEQRIFSHPGFNGETGTGLGLILCKEFVEKNNGSIWLKSKLKEGTTVGFSLPKNKS
jgi:PAS domain S-box-containing protein